MKKLLLISLVFFLWGCESNEPERLIVGDWVLTGATIVNWGGGQYVKYDKEWWVEKFTRRGQFERFINDTLRMAADYSVGADGKTIQFSNVYWYDQKGRRNASSMPISIYQLDRQTLVHSQLASHSDIYTFRRKR